MDTSHSPASKVLSRGFYY